MNSVYVTTPCGVVEGRSENGITRFLGIRYATAGRFEHPHIVTHWEGAYPAVEFGPAPYQERSFLDGVTYKETPFYHREFFEGTKYNYSEDCLNLNIWAPDAGRDLPVLVMLYGGGFRSGQANEKEFDGEPYARRGIVFISFNYRVNILGLLSLPELKEKYGECGNCLFHDQLTALRWVKRNVSAFGGDPKQITVIGQSAGAFCAELLIKSPENRGLIQRGILSSLAGTASRFNLAMPDWMVYSIWREVYRKSGCSNIDRFVEMPIKELYDIWYSIGADSPKYVTFHNDGIFFGKHLKSPANAELICGFTENDLAPQFLWRGCKKLLDRQSALIANTYGFEFIRKLPGDESGAFHSADLWYTYSTLDRSWRPFSAEDYILSEIMVSYFANFAKTGDPNGKDLPSWHRYDAKQHELLLLDVGAVKMGQPKQNGNKTNKR